MKIRFHLKDPDGCFDSVQEAVKEDVAKIPGLNENERDSVEESRRSDVWDALEKWVEYKEYVTLEFDTEAGTAVVVQRKL